MEPPSNVNQMVPPCAQCGSPRVFEFQLMPALVSLLRSARLSLGLSDTYSIFSLILFEALPVMCKEQHR